MENESQPPAVTKVNYPIAYGHSEERRPVVLNDISCLHVVRAFIPPRPRSTTARHQSVAVEMP